MADVVSSGFRRQLAEELLATLDAELPALPEPRVPSVPQPSPQAELKEIDKAPGERGRSKGKKRAEKVARWSQPIPWDEVCFLEKPAATRVASSLKNSGTRVRDLHFIEADLQERIARLECLAAPVSGWVLRMALIDEPLSPPACPESEEVTMLLESALTSRRLRNYDVAMDMLIQARQIWADLLAGEAPAMPWAVPPSSDEDRVSPTQGFLDHQDPETTLKGGLPQPTPDRPDRRYRPDTDFHKALGEGSESFANLSPKAQIFFLCELASLHSALGEEPLALRLLWQARGHLRLLSPHHPDAGVVWAGLGRVAYRMEEFALAARVFSRACRLRERTLGENSMEAATAYNNLACCFSAMQRVMESFAYLELATEILHNELGAEHPRTQVARRNLQQARASGKGVRNSVAHCFVIPVKDWMPRCSSLSKKKRGKKGGGSQSSSPNRRRRRSSSAKAK